MALSMSCQGPLRSHACARHEGQPSPTSAVHATQLTDSWLGCPLCVLVQDFAADIPFTTFQLGISLIEAAVLAGKSPRRKHALMEGWMDGYVRHHAELCVACVCMCVCVCVC